MCLSAQLMNYKAQDPPPPPPPPSTSGVKPTPTFETGKDSSPEWWKQHVFVAGTYTAANCWIFDDWGQRKARFRKQQRSAAWSVGTSSRFLLLRHGLYFRWSIWPRSKTKPPQCKLLGVSMTPWRMNCKVLSKVWRKSKAGLSVAVCVMFFKR